MAKMKLIFPLLLLLLIGAVLPIKEWKKFENGKVESHQERILRLTKTNHTNTVDKALPNRGQRILHDHHSQRQAKHKGKNNGEKGLEDMSNKAHENSNVWEEYKNIKNRHHKKNAEKTLRLLHKEDGKLVDAKSSELANSENLHDIGSMSRMQEDSDKAFPKPINKHSKPEGMSQIQWRRIQKQKERETLEKARNYAKTWLENSGKSRKSQKKKMAISKMTGNKTAKKLWKESFRGENRITN